MKATQDKIRELEAWLQNNHPEHEARTMIENDLRTLKKELENQQPETQRTYERDTFDLRNHVFTFPNERQ